MKFRRHLTKTVFNFPSPLGYVFMLCCAAMACSPTAGKLQPGDIVFQHNACGPLCESIDRVTEGFDGHDYNHCGLVVNYRDSLYVVEAIGADVHLTSPQEFLKRSGGNVAVGRLLPAYRHRIADLQKKALAFLGRPYDGLFELNNEGLYCSELIYEAGRSENEPPLFSLEPMTFRDPATGKTFPPWADYYNTRNWPIPEGKPGINPGSLSRSEKLKIFYLTN